MNELYLAMWMYFKSILSREKQVVISDITKIQKNYRIILTVYNFSQKVYFFTVNILFPFIPLSFLEDSIIIIILIKFIE